MSILKKYRQIIILCCSFIIFACLNVNVMAADMKGIINNPYEKVEKIDSKIPDEATVYMTEKYSEIIEVAIPYYSCLISDPNNYSLGSPFVIYAPSEYNWNSVYYYPLINDNEIVLLISLINTNYGWSISASEEMVDELNLINYAEDTSWIFFLQNECVVAKSPTAERTILDTSHKNENCNVELASDDFLTYSEYLELISSSMNDIKKFNVDDAAEYANNADIVESYSPSFSTSTDTSKVCSLYNARGQQGDTCWAASVATIVNYREGTNYSDYDVCDKIGVGYEGANIDTKLNALKAYGLNYRKSSSQSSWNSIVLNISNKYPLAASTFSGDSGHAVTVYGYRTIGATDYIVLWNSGTGSTQIVTYKSSGSTYTYNSKTWTWTKTLFYI